MIVLHRVHRYQRALVAARMGHVCTLFSLGIVLCLDLGQRSKHRLISRSSDQWRHWLLVSKKMAPNFVRNSMRLNEGRSSVRASVQAII